MSEPIFDNHHEILLHLRWVSDWLTKEWISEGCAESLSAGCYSCFATVARQHIEMYIGEVEEDLGLKIAKQVPPHDHA